MKQKVAVLLLVMLLAVSLVCAQGGREPDKDVIEFWGFYDLSDTSDSRAVMMKEAIDSFEAETGITVLYEQVAWDQMSSKLALQSQSGGAVPDLVQSQTENIPGWVNAGALMDIMPYISSQSYYDDINQFEKDLYERDGKRYAIGLFISGGNWYFDTTMFDGGVLPVTAEDWDREFPRLAAEGNVGITAFMGSGFGGAAVIQGYAPFFYSAGGRLFDDEGKPAFASEENVRVLNWLRDNYQKGYIAEATFTGDWSAAEVPFEEERAAAIRGGSWSFLYLRGLRERYDAGEVVVGPPPSFGEQGYVFMNSEAFAVPNRARNVDNAIKFISHFMEPEILAPWSNAQFGIPVISAALADPIFDHQFYTDTADNLFSHGTASEQSPYYNECIDALATSLQVLMVNPGRDIMSTLKRLEQDLIARYW